MAGKAEMIDYFAPKFDGNNPQKWVFNIHTYLDFHKIPLGERLHIVERNLIGGASEWYEWMKRNNFLDSWHDFLEKVKTCFEPSEFVHYQAQLYKLTQIEGTVAELQAEFEGLVNNIVTGVSESLLVSCFVNGLKHDLKTQVEAAKPRTLVEAFALASYYEEMSPPNKCRTIIDHILREKKENKVGSFPRKRLSPAEIKEKLRKGLCFNCDKTYNPKHPCKCRR